MPKEPLILDVTVRDGSYAIDYQYRPEQVAEIASALDQAGIPLIEVSHGCGLGARENLNIPAAASDADYVMAAKKACKKAKIGVIAGPGHVTKKGNIDSVAGHVDFIRFAANCDDVKSVESNLNYAKEKGIECFFQMMRATRLPLNKLISSAKQVEKMGASLVYVVDTAGHFLPNEVTEIIKSLKKELSIQVGFHGHNNLGMAIANTLTAIQAGADSVDASLLGMGRAGGNAQLEALVSLMKRFGFAKDIDLDLLLQAAQKYIAPIMPPQKGISRIDIATADANIDLYPVTLFEILAKECRADFVEFIRYLAEFKNMTEVGFPQLKETISHFGGDPDVIFAKYNIKLPE